MIEQKDVVVKGETYKLTQFPATTGLKLGKQLIKTLGPSFAELQKGGEFATVQALNTLFDNIDDNAEALIIALTTSASKGSVAINFNMEFAGEYDKLFHLLKEIVEFNFGSVFQLLGSEGL